MSEFYHQDDADLLIDHPLFRDVFALQYQLEHVRYESRDQALEAVMPLVSEFDQTAIDEKLLNRPASLSGERIIMPTKTVDDEGYDIIATTAISASSDHLADSGPVNGMFVGFVPIITESSDGGYLANINYQIVINQKFASSSIYGAACAQAGITSSELIFAEDQQQLAFTEALNTLADASHDVASANNVIALQELLTPSDASKLYDSSRLRRIGRVVRWHELTTKNKDPSYRDGVIDLVTAGLGIRQTRSFSVVATDACGRGYDPEIPDQLTVISQEISHTMAFSGLDFVPYYTHRDSELHVSKKSHTLALSATLKSDIAAEMTYYFPLERLKHLHPEA